MGVDDRNLIPIAAPKDPVKRLLYAIRRRRERKTYLTYQKPQIPNVDATVTEPYTPDTGDYVESIAKSGETGLTGDVTLTGTGTTTLTQVGQNIAINSTGGGTPATTVEDERNWGITPVVGTSTNYARQDHTHGSPADPGGISAHAILDGSVHTDSVADGVTRGSLIYGNATPKWDELVIGSTGYILKSDGTDAAWAAPNSAVPKTDLYTYINVKAAVTDYILINRLYQNETVTTFDGQPDIPRSASVTIIPTLGSTPTGTINIAGKSADNASINEDVTINTAVPTTYETNRAFAVITQVQVTVSGGTAFYSVGMHDRIGVSNYPLNATTDVFKINLNALHKDPTGYTISATYGTIDFDDVAALIDGDDIEIWVRPYT